MTLYERYHIVKSILSRPGKALRLLVTDCEEAVAEIVADGLEVYCDAVVIRTDSGMTATRALQTQHIDLAIIDMSLPDISGFELAELVADCGVPALLISAHPRDQELLVRHGYPNLAKPFRLAALVGAVTNALKNAKENVASLHRAYAMLRGTDRMQRHFLHPALGRGQSPVERWPTTQRERAVDWCDRQLIEGLANHWAGQGLPARARGALAYARCRTAERARALGRAYFKSLANCGAVTLGRSSRPSGDGRSGRAGMKTNSCRAMATTAAIALEPMRRAVAHKINPSKIRGRRRQHS